MSDEGAFPMHRRWGRFLGDWREVLIRYVTGTVSEHVTRNGGILREGMRNGLVNVV